MWTLIVLKEIAPLSNVIDDNVEENAEIRWSIS